MELELRRRGVETSDDDAHVEPGAVFSPALGLQVPHDSPLQFSRLPDAPFGLEVRGISWLRPDADTVRLLTAALRRFLLLVFRGQPTPSESQLDDFFRAFGRLVLDTEDGRAHYSGHRNLGGPASALAKEMVAYQHRDVANTGSTYYDPGPEGASELVWHNDQSHRPMLKVVSVLEALQVDEGVVPTEFRDTYTAYETLSRSQRNDLEHRQVIYFDPRLPPPDEMPRLADAMHPVFTAHPHTGRRAVFVNDFADRIAGIDRADSDPLLAGLRSHLATDAPRYAHQWITGDIVVWDNIGVQHRRDPVRGGLRRHMRQYGGLAE
jgi:alpha-ketoglutarate-dependent taurine dioxygenase